MVGEVLAGMSAIGSLFASLGSGRANAEVAGQIKKRQSELENWYNKEYNTNYLDTEEAQSTIQILRDQMKDQMKKVDQGNAIRGASDEARIATADKLQRNLGQNTTRLAGYATRYKDMIRREYQNRKSYLDYLELQNLQRKADQWGNLAGNAMTAGIGFAQAGGEGAFKDWDEKLASLFGTKQPSAGVTAAYKARGIY